MSLDQGNLARVTGTSAIVVTALQTATAVWATRAGRRDYADVVWGPGLAGVALTGALVGTGDAPRRWGLAALATGWSIRLSRLITRRVAESDEEDPRYTEFLKHDSTAAVVAKVFGTQGVAQLLVTAPLQVAAASTVPRTGRRWWVPLGLVLMLTGAVIEATADRQKSTFMSRSREDRPEVLDTGLWGWSRHPNYFGDSLVWDGAWVASAASPGALWTLPAPVLMSYLLIFATGAKRTEAHMQERPAYRDYQQKVAFFVPRRPDSTY